MTTHKTDVINEHILRKRMRCSTVAREAAKGNGRTLSSHVVGEGDPSEPATGETRRRPPQQ
eukprot:4753317-Pyramimonas_sp.AAC.1